MKNQSFARAHPFFIIALCYIVQGLIQGYGKLSMQAGLQDVIEGFGLLIIAIGMTIVVIGYGTMLRHKTTILNTSKHTSRVITKGIFALSRNPIYLGWLVILAGLAISNRSWTAMIMPIVMFFLLSRLVIAKEEKDLTHQFGNEYLAYKSEIRRWL